MKKGILYNRKSSESEDRQTLSLPAQLEVTDKLAKYNEIEPVKTFSEAKSAKEPDKREKFGEMLQMFERGEATVLVTWSPDRLSRNSMDAGRLIYLVDRGKITEVITNDKIYMNTPMDKFMLQFHMLNAKLNNDQKGEDVKRGLQTKHKLGWYSFVAPQGYLNSPDLEKGYKVIREDPVRFPLVRKMWDLLLTGKYTVPQILRTANEEWAYVTPKHKKIGGGKLSRSGLYQIFSNPFYTGSFQVKGVWYQGNHKPMVSQIEFDQAQIILGRKNAPRMQKHIFPYAGLIECGECHMSVTATFKRKFYKRTGNEREYIYGHCTKKRKDYKCHQPPVPIQELEKQIVEILQEIEIPTEFKDWALKYLREVYEQESLQRVGVQENVQKAYNDTQKQIDGLLDLRLREMISDVEYEHKKHELLQKRDAFKNRLSVVENKADSWLAKCEEVFDFASRAREQFEFGTIEQKRDIFIRLGSNFILKDQKLHVDLKKPFLKFKEAKNLNNEEISRLEPVIVQQYTSGNVDMTPNNLLWLASWNDFRTLEIESFVYEEAKALLSD